VQIERLKIGVIVVLVTVMAWLCGDLTSHAIALSMAVPPPVVVKKAVAGAMPTPAPVEKVVADTRALFAPPPEALPTPGQTSATPAAPAGPWDDWLADPQHNLTLIGTMANDQYAIAIVMAGGQQYAIELAEALGAWRVVEVSDTQVAFQRGSTRTLLQLPMLAPAPTATPPTMANGFTQRFNPTLRNPLLHVRQGSGGVKILDRTEVNAAIHDPGGIARDLRMDPIAKDGQPYGIKFNYLAPTNMFSYLGLRQGDVLLSINGQDLRNQDDGIRAYLMLQNENSLNIHLERNNQPMDLHVEIQ
jgi:general secretion pathway protein C